MNKRLLLIILLVILGAGGYFAFKVPVTINGEIQQKEVWYCPMHPNYRSDRPGKCPICGMSLVKQEQHSQTEQSPVSPAEAGLHHHASVVLNESQQALIGVRTQEVIRKPLVKTIRSVGFVAHDLDLYEAQLDYINAWREYYSFLKRRNLIEEYRSDWRAYYINPTGRPRSQDFLNAQEELIKAEYELRHMGIGDAQLVELRKIKYGQPWVQPDLIFFNEQGNYSVWVYAKIFEQDIGYVDVGQKANIEIPAYGEDFEGIVRTVNDEIDPATRTLLVRIELQNVKSEFKANMLVNVTMDVELNDGLIIPRDAVMDTGIQKIVFVEKENGTFEPRQVKIKAEADGVVSVESGLQEKERVVIDGNFLLDSESRLRASFSEASSAGESNAGGHVHGQ